MAKTLKTGDVLKLSRDQLLPGDNNGWAVLEGRGVVAITASSRSVVRDVRNRYFDFSNRIAKIIKRTPKYVFVEVSK